MPTLNDGWAEARLKLVLRKMDDALSFMKKHNISFACRVEVFLEDEIRRAAFSIDANHESAGDYQKLLGKLTSNEGMEEFLKAVNAKENAE